MKTIGLIGGMSWESTLLYYQAINREVSRRLGGLHSARIVLHSVDFEEVVRRQRAAATGTAWRSSCAVPPKAWCSRALTRC